MKKIIIYFIMFFAVSLFTGDVYANPVKQKFEAATRAFASGNYEQAITLYEETLELYPNLAPAYFYMGMAHRQTGTKIDDIIWLFEKAVEIDPNYAEAHETLGKIFYEKADFEKAEIHCLKTVELEPDNASAKLSLGWIYLMGKSNPEEALIYFEDVIKKHEPPYAYLGLGMAYYLTENRPKVLEMITILRQKDQEQLAQQLEVMIRDNRTAPPRQTGTPIFSSKKPGASLVRDEVPANYPVLTGNKSIENMPVRLSGQLPTNTEINEEASSEERIKALRRRTQRFSKGSGY